MKKSLFGYNKSDVDDKLSSYKRLIELQKKDIEYLKRDNDRLRTVLDDISSSVNLNTEN